MEYEFVETELRNFLQNASDKFEFSYEIINIRKFMRDVFSKDVNLLYNFSNVEKIYIDKYTNPKKRIQWMAGRYAGKKALKKIIPIVASESDSGCIDFNQISILNGLNSAPYIKEYPHLNISISHSYPYCITVVSKHMLGVDIENTISTVEPMLKQFYTANEINEINKMKKFGDIIKLNNKENECKANCLATLYWTRKEAISKLQKCGMKLDFREIDTVYDVIKLKGVPIENVRTVSIQNIYCSLSLAFEDRFD